MIQTLLDFDLRVLAPELVIVAAAALLTIVDLLLKETVSRKWIGILGLLAVLVAGIFVGLGWGHEPYQILGDSYRIDDFSLAFKAILLFGTALVLLFSLSDKDTEKLEAESEYYSLLLTALLGAMIMVSSAELITLFVGLELLSLSSYILVGIRRKRADSAEAAWKYVVLGSVSSAFILYGMSFLYGLTGTTHLFEIQQHVAEIAGTDYQAFLYLSFFLMIVGFGFKISSAPFHTWAPDVYQGAATPVTIFLAVVSKVAAFAFVVRIVLIAFIPLVTTGVWNEVISWSFMLVAALSMIVGNTVALRQKDTKRLMAYSSIAHAGYMLVPPATMGFVGFDLFPSLVFYLVAYLCMTLGAFVVIEIVARRAGTYDMNAFAGLYQRSPSLALIMTFFLLSLAGLPVTAGFIGKFYILMSAIASTHYWLAAIMIATTVISYYYYFGFARQMYFRKAEDSQKIAVSWPTVAVVGMAVLGTILLGIIPDFFLQAFGQLDWVSGFSQAANSLGY
ncbi:NADH-quinone oxidoreductase subunit N [Thermoactinomyces mirandus]|uniref:NADH-quinone oxidoreductase subunit N n=1 Tax=Thermoactinomyces mirandus TaxID=2756294 RepID=A0A7W2ARH1_9BACL|nr:NADH-quinone oxidoreductase subunit N [Thermoactinomyces mirandus]MBA4602974.1 NADH-quinone oxidoreductase subunit N [Thermoactinomyces mirandus]